MVNTVSIKESGPFMKDKIETDYVKIWKEQSILYCVFSDNLEIDLNVAVHCVKERIDFSNNKSYCCLIDMRNLKFITKEAREYLATEGSKYVIAGALVTDSPLSNALANIFLLINKPPVPTKLFSSEKEALIWLKKHGN